MLQTCAPLTPRSDSIIARLTGLAKEVFDGIYDSPAFGPAREFHTIVSNAASIIIVENEDQNSQNGGELDEEAMQSLLNLIETVISSGRDTYVLEHG